MDAASLGKDLLWSIPALFLTRIPVFLNLYILGPAYLCLMMRRTARGRMGTIGCLLGVFSMYQEPDAGKYGILILLLWITEEWHFITGELESPIWGIVFWML